MNMIMQRDTETLREKILECIKEDISVSEMARIIGRPRATIVWNLEEMVKNGEIIHKKYRCPYIVKEGYGNGESNTDRRNALGGTSTESI